METQEKKWPCLECTKEEFEEFIRKKLEKWGYNFTCFSWIDSANNLLVVNCDGMAGFVDCIEQNNVSTVSQCRHLCNTIEEFLEDAKVIAIRRGWYKSVEPKQEEKYEEQQEDRKWPCVRCTREQYDKQIRDNLLKWGYREAAVSLPENHDSYIVTDFGGCIGEVASLISPYDEWDDRHLYKTIPTFLAAAKEVAIREGWFEEEEQPDQTKQQSLDSRYMRMAYIWAENSYCERRKVGALIVKDKMIISDGYNGTPSGFPNVCENEEGSTFSYVLHAEANAITKVAKSTNNCEGATLYVTTSPCIECSKLIIQAGIKRVVYSEEYHNTEGIELLKQAGIMVEKI